MADFDYHDVFLWHPGNPPEEGGVFKDAGTAVIDALYDLHSNAERFAKQRHLSAEGAAALLAPYRAKVVAEVAKQQRVVAAEAAELNAAEHRLFAAPAIESSDAAGSSRDVERRAWYDALDANTRDEFEAQAREGKHPDIVRALARSPVPGRGRAFGVAAYRAEVERTKPAPVRYLERHRRGWAWAEGTLNVALRVAASDLTSDKRAETPQEKMNRARRSMKPHHTA